MKNRGQNSEVILIKNLRKGDEQAFKIIFNQHHKELCNYVYKLSSNMNLSKDLVQNVFIRIWEKKKNLHINSSLKSYLYKACHNEFLMHLRAQKKEIDMLDHLRTQTLLQIFIATEENQKEMYLQQIEITIEQLPEKCKEVFKLSRLKQKRNKEIAKLLGISTRTVEKHISNAIQFLKLNTSNP
ncbi:RNA polymerase sigma factor [Aquimarina litoralis]|uniref:RNA polymerase sigma factor n=1 Tax=Aquimarina litoralis TaxID=584605 RepID=UPI001C5634DC|nr:RNA polymerase sigma-70 factor [Aquimarina litoralis]MBW1294569.1 RNA polymerase sigma-70 factor [Aquimarina litoralis]